MPVSQEDRVTGRILVLEQFDQVIARIYDLRFHVLARIQADYLRVACPADRTRAGPIACERADIIFQNARDVSPGYRA